MPGTRAVQAPKTSLWLLTRQPAARSGAGEVAGQELAALGVGVGPGEQQGHGPPTPHSPVWAPVKAEGALPSSQGRQGPQGLLVTPLQEGLPLLALAPYPAYTPSSRKASLPRSDPETLLPPVLTVLSAPPS